jgi:nucleoid-associated protein YgaU
VRWRAIWTANRDVVGLDPDLIHPGQALRLPGTHTDEDGAR